jgi:formylglycine-generating enzyme required for sulfatase activity
MNELPIIPEDEPVPIAPGLTMCFRRIPPLETESAALASGQPLSFLMGTRGSRTDEEPRHRVVIPKAFYLGTVPVTQEQFACFRREHRNGFHGNPSHPAEDVSWDDAQEFLSWVNACGILTDGLVARLPWEAEWEYACRAGTETQYWNGNGEGALHEVGWFNENSQGTTQPVGLKRHKPWGLHDMHGNVWEWCEDVYDEKAYAKRRDGWTARAWEENDAGKDVKRLEGDRPTRVMRGGSWNNSAEWCRAAIRGWGLPHVRIGIQGVRVLLWLPGPVERGEGREGAGGRDDRPGDWKAGAPRDDWEGVRLPPEDGVPEV